MFQFSKSTPRFRTNSIPNPMNNESPEPEGSITIYTDVLEAAIRSKLSTDIAIEVSSQAKGSSSTKPSNDEPKESNTESIYKLEAVLQEKMELEKNDVGYLLQCIMRPTVFKERTDLYKPRYESIGPHYKSLKLEEKIKRQPLFMYMKPGSTMLRDCIDRIKNLEGKARGCYQTPIVDLSSDEFVEIMLIDSLLIIDLLTAPWNISLGRNIPYNLTDLLLVENQIPFFIVLEIWEIIKDRAVELWFGDKAKITGPIQKLMKSYNRLIPCATVWNENVSKNKNKIMIDEVKHVLDLYYQWNVPIPKRVFTMRNSQMSHEGIIWGIQPATELYKAGIEFKPKSDFLNIFDISFENGILSIPTLVLDSRNFSVITNLVSHEMRTNNAAVVVSYVFFMDSLINTKDDVALLQKFDVLSNRLESDDTAAASINSLGESLALEVTRLQSFRNFYYEVVEDIQHYYASRWHRTRASFHQTYFNNPWSGISLVAGIILSFLTCVQTYYAVFPRK